MSQVKLKLLGAPTVDLGDGVPRLLPTQKSASLLGFLSLHREKWHPRESLATLLWGESSETSARKCLRTELWRLGGLLKPGSGESPLAVTRSAVMLDPGTRLWIDVAAFTTLTGSLGESRGRELSSEEARRLDEAAGLYRGDLLEGCSDEWCLSAREQMRSRFITVLERLFNHHRSRGDAESAVVYAQRILELEPLLEQTHHDLMECFYAMGNRTAALRQFMVCAELLERELGVEPMPAMVQLYRRIKRKSPAPLAEPGHLAPGNDAVGLREELKALKGRLNEMQDQIERILGELLVVLAALPLGLPG